MKREEIEQELRAAQRDVHAAEVAFHRVAEHRRQVILAARELGLSYPKIAAVLGITHQKVQRIVKR